MHIIHRPHVAVLILGVVLTTLTGCTIFGGQDDPSTTPGISASTSPSASDTPSSSPSQDTPSADEPSPAESQVDAPSESASADVVAPDHQIPPEESQHATVSSEAGLNLRTGPGTSYPVILVIPSNAKVLYAGYSDDIGEWDFVDYNGTQGWVSSEYLLFEGGMAKPVIYLYPTAPCQVSVQVDFTDGRLTHTEPRYTTGWNVWATPTGSLTDLSDGKTYPYLFWEADAQMAYDTSTGFVVAAGDTQSFLRDKLAYMGLLPREYAEFIDYWLPILTSNPYNLITFQTTTYAQAVDLKVIPEPDSLLRVFMAYKPLSQPREIPQQRLTTFVRTGFAVVEWGGGEIPYQVA